MTTSTPAPTPAETVPQLLPGDVVLTSGGSLLGRAIRWAERVRGEAPARVNHAAVVVRPPDVIIEAAAEVREVSLWTQHTGDGILVYRNDALTPDQVAIIQRVSASWIGRTYPVKQLFAYLIDNKVFGGRMVTRWLLTPQASGVCSRLVSVAFASVGLDFGVSEPDPDDIDDYCWAHTSSAGTWRLIYVRERAA